MTCICVFESVRGAAIIFDRRGEINLIQEILGIHLLLFI